MSIHTLENLKIENFRKNNQVKSVFWKMMFLLMSGVGILSTNTSCFATQLFDQDSLTNRLNKKNYKYIRLSNEDTDIDPLNFSSHNMINDRGMKYDEQNKLYYTDYSNKENQSLECKSEEGLFEEGRSLGISVQQKEWNCHFHLEIIYKRSNRKYYASGILVRSNILLSSASALYHKEEGYPDQIDCFAARYNNNFLVKATVYPKKYPSSVFVSEEYKKEIKNIDFLRQATNIGFIKFDDGTASIFKEKNITIASPYTKLSQLPLNKLVFYITGYAGEPKAYTSSEGHIQFDDKNKLIKHDIRTAPGQSGSGIWFMNEGKVYCVGIHTGESSNSKIDIPFTQEIVTAIKDLESVRYSPSK